MVDIWQVGNTGVRNPLRIQAGLKVYAESNLIGQIRGVHGAVSFMKLLCEKGILNNESGKDVTGSYGRKWRLVFNLNGFTYPDVEQEYGFSQKELGSLKKNWVRLTKLPLLEIHFFKLILFRQFKSVSYVP